MLANPEPPQAVEQFLAMLRFHNRNKLAQLERDLQKGSLG